MPPLTTYPFIVAFFFLATLGGYATLYSSLTNNFLAALIRTVGHLHPVSGRYLPGGPEPFKSTYTGIRALDEHLCGLVGFFLAAVDGQQDLETTLGLWGLMAMFFSAWLLLVLEGLRAGNKRRWLAWTGAMGAVVQNVTFTVTVPVWLAGHLCFGGAGAGTRPVRAEAVVVESAELVAAVPWATGLAFFVPAVAVSLPSPGIVPSAWHYTAAAAWQAFPVWNGMMMMALEKFLPSSPSASSSRPGASVGAAAGGAVRKRYMRGASKIYSTVLALLVSIQTPMLVAPFLPTAQLPQPWRDVLGAASLKALYPSAASLLHPPTIDPYVVPVADEMAPLTRHFLQWDMMCGGLAMLVWALYLHRTVRPEVGLGALLGTTGAWCLLGGPVAATAALLWDRDEAVVEEGRKRD